MATKRRGRGEGAIFLHSKGLWCASLTVGYDEKGTRKRRYVYGKTKKEVQNKLSQLQHDNASGNLLDPKKIRVGEFLEQWLETVAKPSVRTGTYLSYKSVLKNHAIPHIGGILLSNLQPIQIQNLYRQLEKLGCSPRMRELVHISLRRAFVQAVRWNYLQRNLCDLVQRPRVTPKSMSCFNAEQANAFLKHAREDRLYALYLLAIATGLRQGELFGLKWDDIGFEFQSISVQRTVYEAAGHLEIHEPKTAAGRRRVDLPEIAIEGLKEHKEKMIQEGTSSEWIFCDQHGGPLRRSNFRNRSFCRIMKSANLPQIRFHDLRHTAATLLLSQGVHPKIVQERLGHARISITLDTYSHVLPSMQKDAAAKINSILKGSPS